MEVSERAGVPAVGIFGRDFLPMAELLAERSGLPLHRLAVYPGMMATDSIARLAEVARQALAPQVVRGLTATAAGDPAAGVSPAVASPTGPTRPRTPTPIAPSSSEDHSMRCRSTLSNRAGRTACR